jgi:hypothetical protein
MSDDKNFGFGRTPTLEQLVKNMTKEELEIWKLQTRLIELQIKAEKRRWLYISISFLFGFASAISAEPIRQLLL